ncbi:MAG: hypothetical protein V4568_12630, partial [Pseudomonadota bacterium]
PTGPLKWASLHLDIETADLLETRMAPKYESGNSVDKQYEAYIENCATSAKPEKYKRGNGEGEIVQTIVTTAATIIDKLSKGVPMPEPLQELIDSVNEVQQADNRDNLAFHNDEFVTLEHYATTAQHPLWREFVEKKFPEPFESIIETIQELEGDIEKIESKIGLPKKPLDVDPKVWKTSEAYTKALSEWSSANAKEAKELQQLKQKLEQARTEHIPQLVKDLFRQYVTVEPFMTSSKHHWEPKGLHNRRQGANYFVKGFTGDKACLQIDGSTQNSVNLVAIDNKELLEHLRVESGEEKHRIEVKQKYWIAFEANGKIKSVEFKGWENQHQVQHQRGNSQQPGKKSR